MLLVRGSIGRSETILLHNSYVINYNKAGTEILTHIKIK